MQHVCILGSTGSIGQSTLDVIARHPERFRVFALAANRSVEKLFEQVMTHAPRFAVLRDAGAAQTLRNQLREAGSETEVLEGAEGLDQVAKAAEVDVVMAAIVGAAGLLPTLAAVRAGKRLLLANKEALVMTGELLLAEARQHGAIILPIDSEHNAIFQCLPDAFVPGSSSPQDAGVSQILLTASGGPFRTFSKESLANVSPEQACAHPNWEMGRKISVDSATLMNKGLEFIEACYLFGARADQIRVLVHPQSVVHSLVAYTDGSVLAQLGSPDMRTPIAYGLGWPDRIEAGVKMLDLAEVASLDFEAPDEQRFPALSLARQAFEAGGTAPAILNAANEVGVEAFLANQIAFPRISTLVADVLQRLPAGQADSLETILAADRKARDEARGLLKQ